MHKIINGFLKYKSMKHLKYLFLFVGLALLASCSDSDVQGLVGDGNQAAFSGRIGEFQTRVTDNSWDEGDAIGIFAVMPGQELSNPAIFDGKNNVQYLSDAKGEFKPAAEPIKFPENGELDFIAYYPFKNALSDFTYNIDVSKQANPAAIDLLYSNNAKGESGDEPFVNLSFKHMLSRLMFNIKLEEGLSFDDGFNVSIKDIVVDGSFDLATGEVAFGSTKKTISPVVTVSSDKKLASASSIVVPGQDLSDVTVVFSLGGKDYEWTPYAQSLKSTTKYSYALKLYIDESGIPVVEELEVGATIEDWIEEEVGGEIPLAPTGDSEEPVEGEYKTIEDIRTMYADSGEDELTITEALELKAVVISDREGGNSTSLKNGYIQDEAGNGLGFRTTENHEFNLGEELIIDLEGAVISTYGDALQLGFAPDKATVENTGVTVAPKELTLEQVLDGMYDGELVNVTGVQFKEYEGHTYHEGESSAYNHAIENANGKTIDVRTARYATFKDDALPKGSGNIVGIMTVFNGNWQVYPRNTEDLAGMSDDVSTRFTDEDPDPVEPGEGDGTKANPYTIEQAMANQGAKDNTDFVWVRAYIVGTSNSGGDFVPIFSTDNASGTNVVVAAGKEETNIDKLVAVQLAFGGDARSDLNLESNPGMYKAEVKLYGTLEAYFGAAGLKNVKEYEVITPGEGGTVPEPEDPIDPSEFIMYEPLAADLGSFIEYSVEGDNTWHGDEFAGEKFVKMSGFEDGTNEDWLISPAIDLSKVSKAELSFSHLVGFTTGKEAEELTVWISSNYNSGNPNDATWEQITVTYPPKHPTSNFSDWYEETVSIPSSIIGKSGVRVAFKYISGDTGAMTWEVMKVGVK